MYRCSRFLHDCETSGEVRSPPLKATGPCLSLLRCDGLSGCFCRGAQRMRGELGGRPPPHLLIPKYTSKDSLLRWMPWVPVRAVWGCRRVEGVEGGKKELWWRSKSFLGQGKNPPKYFRRSNFLVDSECIQVKDTYWLEMRTIRLMRFRTLHSRSPGFLSYMSRCFCYLWRPVTACKVRGSCDLYPCLSRIWDSTPYITVWCVLNIFILSFYLAKNKN